MSRRIFHCSHSDSTPSAAGAKTDDEDCDPSKFSSDSESEDAQPSTKASTINRVSHGQPHCNRQATIAHGN